MSTSINRVCISGNLTKHPELRQTQSGAQVLSMGVAVNERAKDPQTGEWGDRPSFVDVTVWGNRAQALAGFLRKGTHVAVSGRLRQDRWQDRQTGENRSRLGVVADEVDVMTPRDRGQEPAKPQAAQAQQVPYSAPAQEAIPYRAPAAPQPGAYDEDIPF
jgi:single-strand DNA-binding protein